MNSIHNQATTFEQSFKEIFKSNLEKLFEGTNKKFQVSNDINFKPFENQSVDVVAIIKSGNGTRQFVEGFDMTTYPINISFILEVNFLQEFLGLMNTYISLFSGSTEETDVIIAGKKTKYYYQMILNTPSSLGQPIDLRAGNKIINIVTVVMMGEVHYTSTGVIDPPNFKIRITTKEGVILENEVKGILFNDSSTVPQVEPFYIFGSQYAHNIEIVKTSVQTLQIVRLLKNPLHELLSNIADGLITVTNFEVSTDSNSNKYNSYTNHQVTKIYQNGIETFNIVLSR